MLYFLYLQNELKYMFHYIWMCLELSNKTKSTVLSSKGNRSNTQCKYLTHFLACTFSVGLCYLSFSFTHPRLCKITDYRQNGHHTSHCSWWLMLYCHIGITDEGEIIVSSFVPNYLSISTYSLLMLCIPLRSNKLDYKGGHCRYSAAISRFPRKESPNRFIPKRNLIALHN